ncbi:nucleoplasmin-like protein [Phlebotomus argentipes]|uniref:nucleoplasmin-like protein n=1 Tax=Phlebotomus argentipes TaxID=94469 RepID=UPI00289304C2|nr:nucleoplasmin-like protein [Phlebotomus argentipes]
MTDDYFYGVTLTSTDPSQTWDPFHNDDDEELGVWNKLLVKQMLLGHEAKEGEYNVVEAATQTMEDVIKIPIAVLKVGEARNVCMQLEFVAPVIFTLVKGAGPVHIHGHHLIGEASDPDMWDEEGVEEEEPEDGAEGEENGSARRKQKFPKVTTTKAAGLARNKRK